MENLKELVYIVNCNKVKCIDMFDLNVGDCFKVNVLY